ncbi:MAG TPA: YegS/Rv2252/BmrU family lipid kinase [Nocardioidaceae bacterium]|nr:YegS/Rv2252/BmrU family lipid kinase [Nocardioidaceae bacterium]
MLLITNTEAGSSDDESLAEALAVLRRHTDVEVARTSNPGELDGVLQRRGGRRIVVAGGDGSMHAVVAALHRRNELTKGTLALIPLGTGNDFARGTGIPLDAVEAAETAVKGDVRPVDLLVNCAGQIVVNAVHFGIGAEAGKQASAWKKWLGRLGYPVGALIAAFTQPGIRLHVEADGEVLADLDRAVIQVAIGNGSNVGGGTELTPEASVEDGLADVVVSFATTPWAKIGSVRQLVSGSHLERDDVVMTRASRISISGQDFYCNADGEIYGPEVNHEWHVEAGAFRMALPPA